MVKWVKRSRNGRVSICRYKQKQKVAEISPVLSILACGPVNEISLNMFNFSQKLAILKVVLLLQNVTIQALFQGLGRVSRGNLLKNEKFE